MFIILLINSFPNYMDKNTIIIGNLSAKHSTWGCCSNNGRGIDILQYVVDNDFMSLNDGTPTHTSFSYITSEALDIAMTSTELTKPPVLMDCAG
ncbi:hypothetical protein AVEN_273526-1 [Araneus ventricosus]|uniref:Endonuclease/exonuclease/phosphatase domain-containing protein n=1 Tax=Araneus ventricosus TaxID=182803 RepID=A0A4Y2H640_ARAVE|nr:hypothetical protein AVEN_273526-1 [Araneus ventricosus]